MQYVSVQKKVGAQKVVIERYPVPDPPHLGAIQGVVGDDFIVQDADGTQWLVSDLRLWYRTGRADRRLRELV